MLPLVAVNSASKVKQLLYFEIKNRQHLSAIYIVNLTKESLGRIFSYTSEAAG